MLVARQNSTALIHDVKIQQSSAISLFLVMPFLLILLQN